MHTLPTSIGLSPEEGPADRASVAYLFGSFRLVPSQQTLLDGGVRVPIGGRALDLLIALVERRGDVVSKQSLMASAWPQTVVEESNLKVHIGALRKLLGEEAQDQQFVATVVGRGYRFVAPVVCESLSEKISKTEKKACASHNIPVALVRLIGRSETVRNILERFGRVRLLTLAGTGGVGKTSVALIVAQRMVEAGEHDVWFVNLSSLSDADRLPHAVANALNLDTGAGDVPAILAQHLRALDRPQLFILDNCEHVIETAAVMAEYLMSSVPRSLVLATSREPLRAAGEHVYRLEPFDCPVDATRLTVEAALQYPAIELFAERGMAARSDYALSEDDLPVVVDLCRRLDGIALAIELVASRLDAFGVRELRDLLDDDRLRSVAQGRRTAPERQRNLMAALDWSHVLLPDIERTVLRRLGVFPGAFALGAAAAVVADEDLPQGAVIDAVGMLVAKSLVTVNSDSDARRYCLLNTTRDYARRKLADAGETDEIACRHARHQRNRFRFDKDFRHSPFGSRATAEHAVSFDDVEAPLDYLDS